MAGPQPLYSDPNFGAGVGNLGTLLFGDPKVRAQAALNEKHGLYYDASAANQRTQAELRAGQIKARAGMGEAARNAGIGDAVAALIHSAINAAGPNDTSENITQSIGNLRGQNMVAPLTPPGAPAPAPPTEMGARVGVLLMNGGKVLPTKDTAITPERQTEVIGQHEDAATKRTGITAGAHLAGTKYSADRRLEGDKYGVDNKPVDAGPGHVVTVGPNNTAGQSAGTRIFNGQPQSGRAGTNKVEDDLRLQAMKPGPEGDAARETLRAYTVAGAGGKIAVEETKSAGRANVAKINVNGRQMVEVTRQDAARDRTAMLIDGRYWVEEKRGENALAVQDSRNQGAAAVQGQRNEGALAVQGARNEGNLAVQDSRNEGSLATQDSRNQGASAVQGQRNEGALAVQNSRNQGASTVQGQRNEGNLAVQDSRNQGTAVVQDKRTAGQTLVEAMRGDQTQRTNESRERIATGNQATQRDVAAIRTDGQLGAAEIGADARTEAAGISADASRDVARTNADGRGKVKALNPLQQADLLKDIRAQIDARVGVQRDKSGARVAGNYPLDPAIETEITNRAAVYVDGGEQVSTALDRAWSEVVGSKPLARTPGAVFGLFGGDYQTPGGVASDKFQMPSRGAAPARPPATNPADRQVGERRVGADGTIYERGADGKVRAVGKQ